MVISIITVFEFNRGDIISIIEWAIGVLVTHRNKQSKFFEHNSSYELTSTAPSLTIFSIGDLLSIIVTNQKYSLLSLEFRNALSDIIIFKCSNSNEINRIKDELMADLDKNTQDMLLDLAWKNKYSFLYVKPYMPLEDKYYIMFDKVVF